MYIAIQINPSVIKEKNSGFVNKISTRHIPLDSSAFQSLTYVILSPKHNFHSKEKRFLKKYIEMQLPVP